ncbi:hypothetical protein COY51_03100 [Candidatus Desantisbacteria bacterium CG_4_10_14_0_8_um_filter_39_17]|uniref:Rod shape-determining protein MreD n=1 Tax=Candidatus Desantisbacteria bacterium CG_4_10_14_0_8_um_filter_39_17 TaxID=1974542 RepID=A0A2H9PD89_9BACT|nr:MAG: hypothetical protein COY51_03100 [Candidatus Desantisbacteria bacterium CG_4_10_14_0_8_um_filter_39_17]
MTYYILVIISIVITMIVQISIAQFIQIASVVPNLLVLPLIFFSLARPSRYKSGERYCDQPTTFILRATSSAYFENVFRGIFLGFFAGLSQGINSRLFWADVFSWVLVGFLLGLVIGPINRENPVVQPLLLFLCTFLQGMFFFIPLYISPFTPSPSSFFLRLLFCSLYTTLLGTFILRLTEEKRKEGVILDGD